MIRRWITGPLMLWCISAVLFVPPAAAVTLADSVNAPTLPWTTGGDAPWAGETTMAYDGVDAAQSGAITNAQTSWVETSFSGESQVTFWWKVSSEQGGDFLTVYVDGAAQSGAAAPISGEVDWTPVTLYVLGAGTHTLRWEYKKDANDINPVGSDSAWLDYVMVTPATISTITENLVTGWNLISSPEVVNAAALAAAQPDLVSLWTWENGTWVVYFSDGTTMDYAASKGFGAMTTIYPGEGFWLNTNAPITLTYHTTAIIEDLFLVDGWNLDGLEGSQPVLVSDIVSLAQQQLFSVVSLWKWTNNTWSVSMPGEGDMGAAYANSKGFTLLTDVTPGEGFWIRTLAQ